MKVLILGGNSGFIGSHLSQYLSSSFDLQFVSMRNLDAIEAVSFSDCVVNLVGKAHDFSGTATEQEFYYANVELAKIAFEQFINSEARLFIHVSSLSAIEELSSGKILTEQDTCQPVSFYGKSKRVAEQWLVAQTLPKGKKMIIVRPPMVHGAGDKGNLKQLYNLVIKGIPYPLAAFKNNRSFLSIKNFCFFIEQIITKQAIMPSGIYHLSDDESLSSIDIIQVIKEVTGKKTALISVPKSFIRLISKLGDRISLPLNSWRLEKLTSNLLVSNEKIKTTLAIERLPLTAKEGLIQTIQTFKK